MGTGLIASAALIALLYFGRDFFVTLIVSIMLAILLDPAVVLVMKLRVPRAAATGIVTAVALIAVYLLTFMLWSQVSTIREDLPTYTSRLSQLFDKANESVDSFEKKTIDMVVPKTLRDQEQQIQQKPQQAMKARRRRSTAAAATPPANAQPVIQEVRIHPEPKPVLTTLYSYVSGYFHVLVMASFIPFLVYFMLSWRDHITNSVLRLFESDHRFAVGRSWSGIGDSTRAYVLGNFLLWVFLSSISAITFFFLGVPYWLIVGPLSALFSLVPYAGLALSVLPPVMAAVAVPNKLKVILTLVLITVGLHLIAMNFLYAKIIGRRVRLNPLVVTLALMFWGLLWGAIGLVLAIPITAAVKAVCDNVETLEPYGRILGDAQET
ncbi:MAG TPA: AI-2E family transporter [Bryobacteraceae bacterium]|nr:AI-2E family transporter [Bryobacteraceae bacterium]